MCGFFSNLEKPTLLNKYYRCLIFFVVNLANQSMIFGIVSKIKITTQCRGIIKSIQNKKVSILIVLK